MLGNRLDMLGKLEGPCLEPYPSLVISVFCNDIMISVSILKGHMVLFPQDPQDVMYANKQHPSPF